MIDKARVGENSRVALEALLSERPTFAEFIVSLRALGRVAVVGGAPRDWTLGLTPRDIDLVVDGDPDSLEKRLGQLAKSRTGLGGLRIEVDGLRCDVWSLSSSWPLSKNRSLPISFQSLPKTAFLNIDAIAVELDTWTVHECGFVAAWPTKTIELNYAPNPRPAVCIAHAISAAARYRLTFGNALSEHIEQELLTSVPWHKVIDAYVVRYERALSQLTLEDVYSRLCDGEVQLRLRALLEHLSITRSVGQSAATRTVG